MTVVHNEQTKLAASALDRLSTACMVAGVLGPLAGVLYTNTATNTAPHGILVWIGSVCWIVSAGF
ncbi:hypothetical protein ABTM91_20695, partial [Acinetobacter baumannii]